MRKIIINKSAHIVNTVKIFSNKIKTMNPLGPMRHKGCANPKRKPTYTYNELSPAEKKIVAAENKAIGLNFSLKKLIRDCEFSFKEDGYREIKMLEWGG